MKFPKLRRASEHKEKRKMRTEDEINEAVKFAHERIASEYWRGFKTALLWVAGVIDRFDDEHEG